MTTFTLTATPQPATTPPSIRLDVTESGTPTVGSVTVLRADADGRTRPVRTLDGGPLTISAGTGTVIDNEYPYGTAVTYRLQEATTVTAAASMAVASVWLTHPGVPSRSMPIVGSALGDRTRVTSRGVYKVISRRNPVTISGGQRASASSAISIATPDDATRIQLDNLLDDESVLLLNVPTSLPWGLNTCYISVGDSVEARLWRYAREPRRNWTLPYQEVDRPGGGTQAAVTWATIAAQYPTWADIPAGTTWADLMNPTS